jgi:prephenate dehydratase
VAFHDTAGAAREVAERGAPGDGAIASRLAADRYGLVVLESDVADDPSNRTRFLVIERSEGSSPVLSGAAKFSLGFVAEHRPGGLARVLEVFARNGMNLTRLDSRPIPDQPFHYSFYADVELPDASQYPSLIRDLGAVTSELRPFGVYRPAQVTDET